MFNFNYDPQRQGYDQGVWKTVTGAPAISGNDLLLNAAAIVQQADCLRGTYNFKITLAGAPTAGYLTGGTSATSVVATWKAVTDGEFAITIDGVAYDITGINFTGVTTMAGVAAKLQEAIRTATGGLETVAWSTNKFVITGLTDVSVTSAVSGGTGTDISGAGATAFMDAETGRGTVTSGSDKRIGLISLAKDVKALFLIYGNTLRCITKDEDGVTKSAINIAWKTAWTTSMSLSIKWYGTGVSFYVNEEQVASFNSDVPNSSMSPYIYNTDADNLLVSYTEGVNVDTYIRNLSTLSKGTYNATEPTLSDGDESSLQLNENGELKVTGGAGASSVSAEYISPSDFTATYTSASTITLSGVPVTITDSSQIAYIKQVKTDNTSNTFVNGANDITLSYSANVITVYEKGVAITSLASGDVYEIGVNGTKKAYDLSTDADKIINLTPESSKYVQDSLVDTTNVAAATNYYPSSTGMSMDGYKDFSLSGKFIDADGTMTLSIEATNDEDTTNADWIDISLLGIDSKTGINVITAAMTVTNGTLTFGIEYNDLNYSNIRVKMVNDGATNTAIIKARRKAL
jgi:hypothetical protein